MKKLMIAAGAAAVFATFSFGALADEITGTIESIDSTTGMVTLDNGKIFKMPTTVALATFKSGQKVMITFEGQGTPALASAIALAPLAPAAGSAPATPPLSGGSPGPTGGNAGPTNNPGAPRD